MFSHVVLGFLRDGRARHGYDLLLEYRRRCGEKLNPGNLYRELGRLAANGMVQAGVNPPGADSRRIPYQITDGGRHAFDQWLAGPDDGDGDLPTWLMFIDRVPAEMRTRMLDRRQEQLWMQGKLLARQREDALADALHDASPQFCPLPFLLERRIKLLTAELEFLKHFRMKIEPAGGVASLASPDLTVKRERRSRR